MSDLVIRAQFGHRYMAALRALRLQHWFGLREKWDDLPLWERLVLIHPDWLRDAGMPSSTIEGIQGPRAFPGDRPTGTCASRRIWGYDCPIEGRLEADHLWPYALGGPTRPGNTLALCRDHNSLKGVDIHAFPWDEDPAPTGLWLDRQVSLIAYALGERE